MKNLYIVVALLVLGTVLFTSCSADDLDTIEVKENHFDEQAKGVGGEDGHIELEEEEPK